MRSVKINKIAAACLLMVVIGISQATQPIPPLAGYIEEKVEMKDLRLCLLSTQNG